MNAVGASSAAAGRGAQNRPAITATATVRLLPCPAQPRPAAARRDERMSCIIVITPCCRALPIGPLLRPNEIVLVTLECIPTGNRASAPALRSLRGGKARQPYAATSPRRPEGRRGQRRAEPQRSGPPGRRIPRRRALCLPLPPRYCTDASDAPCAGAGNCPAGASHRRRRAGRPLR